MNQQMPSAKKPEARCPRILVVDDEPDLRELVEHVVHGKVRCRTLSAGSLAEARKIMSTEPIELLVADVNLPDGDGTQLLDTLHVHQPHAGAIVITGAPSIDNAVAAIRQGAGDFLPKPFSADQLVERLRQALDRQRDHAKTQRRICRLRDALRRLNHSRKIVSKKVDLLCNDLINAYGELSRQLDGVRTQESFRHALAQAKDLEQLLCHAMDWLLRGFGYSNIAMWLSGEEGEFHLGAYMKYTMAGEPELAAAMKQGLVQQTLRQEMLHLSGDALRAVLTNDEKRYFDDQSVLAVNCSYLGDSLAIIVMFREQSTPFTGDHAATIQSLAPIFALALASIVKQHQQYEPDGNPFADDNFADGKNDSGEADWWKRGESPPF